MVLSGMSTMEQVQDNVGHARRARSGNMNAAELALIRRVQAAYRRSRGIPCTGCGYCLPCPHGVQIPRNFRVYNDRRMFPDSPNPRTEYREWMSADIRASACENCGQCEERCPQRIPIRVRLQQVDAALRA
jgi:predicted aldo/keto reductase-like oxidoreductase